jgi:hypothetical protein
VLDIGGRKRTSGAGHQNGFHVWVPVSPCSPGRAKDRCARLQAEGYTGQGPPANATNGPTEALED